MIMETMRSLLQATRALFSDRGSLAIFAGLYALFLAALYGFIATREATVWQVLLTLIFGVALPLALIQFWVEIAGQNLIAFVRGGRAFLTRLGQVLARAFTPQSVLIYVLGL